MWVVLVVEDEPAVRDVLHRVLARKGFTVLVARDGREAMTAVSLYPATIDILLVDRHLPDIDGNTLIDALARERPGMKPVLMSGDLPEDAAIHPERGVRFLAKPFTPDQLFRILWCELFDGAMAV
jgi:two-component system, cell cycle sensor histidine kinase and response regulator CckA